MRTRRASEEDWGAIWPIWRAVAIEGETCPWEPDTDEDAAKAVWMLPPPAEVLVMEEDEGPGETTIVATALLAPSQPGLGNHVVHAMLLVDPKRVNNGGPRGSLGAFQGYGPYGGRSYTGGQGVSGRWESISRQAAEQMIEHAADRGYRAMQLNAVVAANPRLVALWRSLAFRLVGTLPAAYRHPWLGDVDLYVMYRFLPAREI